MQGRLTSMIMLGFASFGLIGAAGAASDSYFEDKLAEDTFNVSCASDPILSETAVSGLPNCSVHRVSSTYGRQWMAAILNRDEYEQD